MRGIFTVPTSSIDPALVARLNSGTATIQIKPSDMLCELSNEPLRDLVADNVVLGRFWTTTAAAEHIIVLMNSLDEHDEY